MVVVEDAERIAVVGGAKPPRGEVVAGVGEPPSIEDKWNITNQKALIVRGMYKGNGDGRCPFRRVFGSNRYPSSSGADTVSADKT